MQLNNYKIIFWTNIIFFRTFIKIDDNNIKKWNLENLLIETQFFREKI